MPRRTTTGRLVVPAGSPPVVRRDYILRDLGGFARWTHLTPAELEAALAEPVVLAGDQPTKMRAHHFAWQVRNELDRLLGGRDAVETGGYRVITTLDWDAQKLAEKYVYAGTVIPHLPFNEARKEMNRLDLKAVDRGWVTNLRYKDLHNGALVALDYRTGDVIAYVGSGGYERKDLKSRQFQPQYDAASAFRQPGSAFKPIVYATAFDERALTPGSLLLDISTDFGGGWAPKNADRLERGPVRVRQALQLSLNLPAIRALERVGNESAADRGRGPRRPVPERPQGVPPVRARGRDRHGRDPPDRPDRGVRRPRQRRRPRADAHGPVDRRPGRHGAVSRPRA